MVGCAGGHHALQVWTHSHAVGVVVTGDLHTLGQVAEAAGACAWGLASNRDGGIPKSYSPQKLLSPKATPLATLTLSLTPPCNPNSPKATPWALVPSSWLTGCLVPHTALKSPWRAHILDRVSPVPFAVC